MPKERTLDGRHILVTRARHQAQEMVQQLEAIGATVINLPMIEITPPQSWQDLDRAIENLDHYDWLVFASSNAVDSFFSRVASDQLQPQSMQVAAIGEATSRAVKDNGWNVSYTPPEALAESFIENFPSYPKLAGLNILWPRGNNGRPLIAEKLKKAGATVNVVAAYQSVPAQANAEELASLLRSNRCDAFVFASGKTVEMFASAAETIFRKPLEVPDTVTLVSIGPETSRALISYFNRVDLEANPHSASGLVEALSRYFGARKATT